jgi:thiol-disulfide isomerase/thioredoxin
MFKFTSLLLASLAVAATAKVVVLNDANFEALTSEKSLVFIKFYAPWCGHCKAMTADWIELGEAMATEKPDLLIAEADCTADDTEIICEMNGVEGFPTLKYGDPAFLEDYSGSREFDEMYSFATTGLKANCSPNNIESCSEEEKEVLEGLLAMSVAELKEAVAEVEKKTEKAEEEFDASTDFLEEEYMGMMAKAKELKDAAKKAAKYDLLKAVQALKKEGEGHDEL